MKEGLEKLVDSLREIKSMLVVCAILGVMDDDFPYEQYEIFTEMSDKIHADIDEFIAAFTENY